MAGCVICNHPSRAEIEQEMQNTGAIRAVARLYQVSKDSLSRHRRKCLAKQKALFLGELELRYTDRHGTLQWTRLCPVSHNGAKGILEVWLIGNRAELRSSKKAAR